MKSILLKIEEDLYHEVEKSAKEIKTSKTAFIKKAVESYIKAWERKKLEKEIAREIAIINSDKKGLEEVRIFEKASLADLDKYLSEENDA